MNTTWAIIGAIGLLVGSVLQSIVGDELKIRLQESAELHTWLASWVIPKADRVEFRIDCRSELDAIGADTLHPLTRLVKAHAYGLNQLVRSPLLRRSLLADRPMFEMLAAPPRWMLQVWRTRFMFTRGRVIPVQRVQNRRFRWVYRIERMGGIDGPTTLVAVGFGHGWHFVALTMPWPGRMSAMTPRVRVAVVRDGAPVMGIVKMRKLT